MVKQDNLDGMFPRQKISMKNKNKLWREKCVDILVGKGDTQHFGYGYGTEKKEMKLAYDLYNSIYDLNDLKYVTNPYNVDEGFPAIPQNVNVIRPKINLLLGEETKRPTNIKVIRTSDIASGEYQDKYKQMLMDYMNATVMSKLGPEEAARYQQALESGEIMPPEQIQKYMSKTYKDLAETTAYHIIEYLKHKLNLSHEFMRTWLDALVAGVEVLYIGVQNNEPSLERVNPLYFTYDMSPDLEFIEDGDWCCRKMMLSYTEVYDRLYDKMDEYQLNKLVEIIDGKPGNHGVQKKDMVDDFNSWKVSHIDTPIQDPVFANNQNMVSVWHVCWKSFKKVGFVVIPDETGQPQRLVVDEDYVVSGLELPQIDSNGESKQVVWDWIIEVWEGYRIGRELYVGIQPLEYQHVSVDNPNSQKLPYTGAIYSNINTKTKSLVNLLKPLQYLYIIIWYRLELAMARDKGKIVTVDITQIPKSMNIDINKWAHYLSSVGVNFINPYECFAPGTKVIMANGDVKNIEDIEIGDQVMGKDGSVRNVLHTHNGLDHMYRLKSRSGSNDQIVNSKHKIHYLERNYNNCFEEKLSTAQEILLDKTYKKNLKYLERVDNIDITRDVDLLLDPYFLGLWLGDGSSRDASITTCDNEIIEYLQKYAKQNQLKWSIESMPENKAILFRLFNRDFRKNPLMESLRHLNVLNNKHIPKDYIYSSEQDRLKLLAGLIDSDGYYSKRDNYYTIVQEKKRNHIIQDAAFIARSLGFKCTVNSYKDKRYDDCEMLQLNILEGDKKLPVKIKRKQAKLNKKRGWKNLSNFKIEYEGIGEFYGIHIDGDHLFLLNDFTVVHNTGWDIPGRDGSNPAAFNQISAMDLTMANVIDGYINLMSKIEQMVSELSGVSNQREGSINQYELVNNVNKAITQSALITEPLFWVHDQVKKRAFTMLLNTAKEVYKQSGKKKLNFVFDDGTRSFLDISESFLFEDFDIFISDATKDTQNLEMIKSLYQPAMQNGATLLDIAEIMTLDNVNLIKDKLEEIEVKRQKIQEQQMQQEQQAAAQLQQMENEMREQELMLDEAKLELDKYKIDKDSETKIVVAELGTYRFQQDLDQNQNGIPDPIEIAELAMKRQDLDSHYFDEQSKLNMQTKELEQKKSEMKSKIQLEEKKLKAQMDIQKQKDKAALEREQIKAKTALKNKVAGEK